MAPSEETTRHGAPERDLACETDVLLAGRYRLGAPIGSGSTGVVYRAEDVMFSRPVAVRLVPAALARDDETLARIEGRLHSNAHMLRDDVRALNDLIDVIDLGRAEDGRIFVVTDLLPATESLAELLGREGPLPWRRLRRLAVRACQIIHLSHEHGVVRQDLQTRNLFPVRDKNDAAVLRIYSPGLGVAFGERLWSCLDPDEALHLARYAAPEQISGGQIDRRTDVYALGVILYEALTGQVPFPDPRASYVLASHLLSRPPPFPPDVRGRGVTPELESIVMRALAKAPDDRWPDVKALANAMAAIEFGPSEKSGVLEAADVGDLTELLEPAPSATTMRIDRRRLSGKPGLGLGFAPGPAPALEVDPSASTSEMAWREILEAAESAVGAVASRREPDARGASVSQSDATTPDDSTPTIPFGAADHSAPRWPAPAPSGQVVPARRRRVAPWAVAAGLALVTAGGVSYLLRPDARAVVPASAARTDAPRASAPVARPAPQPATPAEPPAPSTPAPEPSTVPPAPATPASEPPAPATPAPEPATVPAALPTTVAPTPVPPEPAPVEPAAGSPPIVAADPAEPPAPRPAAVPLAAEREGRAAPPAAKRVDPAAEPSKKPRKRERTDEPPPPPPRKAAPGTALPDRSGHELPDPAAAPPAP